MTEKIEGSPPHPPAKPATRLVTGGRDPFSHHGYVNPPVYHASTVVYRTAEDYLGTRGRYTYGRRGTPTSDALVEAIEAAGQLLARHFPKTGSSQNELPDEIIEG